MLKSLDLRSPLSRKVLSRRQSSWGGLSFHSAVIAAGVEVGGVVKTRTSDGIGLGVEVWTYATIAKRWAIDIGDNLLIAASLVVLRAVQIGRAAVLTADSTVFNRNGFDWRMAGGGLVMWCRSEL